jgi:hypothetical protein
MTPFFAMAFLLSSMAAPKPHLSLLLPQMAFVLLAMWGGLFALRGTTAPRIAGFAFSFFVANVGFALGVVHWMSGKEITTYENTRSTSPPAAGSAL